MSKSNSELASALTLKVELASDIDGIRGICVKSIEDVNEVAHAYYKHTHPDVHNTVGIKIQELEDLGYQDVRPGTLIWFRISGHGRSMDFLKGDELQKALEM